MEIQGTVAPGLEPLKIAFARLWDEVEVGASLCILRNGETIVDLWGGHTDRHCTSPWQADTLVNTYSTTKGLVALALACLVDEGRLSYEAPVADYWPAFGAEKKYDVTVAQLLSHQAGLYRFNPTVRLSDLYDFQAMVFNLASQAPAWVPGTRFGYHAITWGYLAGELIRRITGRSPGTYIRERITAPLGADCYIGLPTSLHNRCADLIGPNHARKEMPRAERPRLEDRLKSEDPVITPFRDACSVDWRCAEIPGSSGHASARGLATCYAASLDGKLFRHKTLQKAITEVTHGEVDQVLGYPTRRAMGFILSCEAVWFGSSLSAFGHTGTGGSCAFADPERGIAFAYVMNQLHTNGGLRSGQLIETLYQQL